MTFNPGIVDRVKWVQWLRVSSLTNRFEYSQSKVLRLSDGGWCGPSEPVIGVGSGVLPGLGGWPTTTVLADTHSWNAYSGSIRDTSVKEGCHGESDGCSSSW